jgi:hypothetical protein
LRGGIFAMSATTFSMSRVRTVFFCLLAGSSCTAAPASSITSIALSGRKRSFTCLADRSAAARSGPVRVLHAVVALVVRLQAAQDRVRLLDARLADLDALEAARERAIALEVALVVLVGGGADAAQLARGERRA